MITYHTHSRAEPWTLAKKSPPMAMDYYPLRRLPVLLSLLCAFSSATPLFPKEALPTKSGYLPLHTAAPSSGAALFFAFYEAQYPSSPIPETPLIVYLQGGPGCSSLRANFFEMGPWLVSTDKPTLRPNPFPWNRLFGILFVDNPLGTGFSTAPSPDDIPRDQPTVARHLWAALQSFLSSDPSFRARPLYLAGSSYAGKFIPAAGYHILQQNPLVPRSQRINLAGVAIGNGNIHPVTQVTTHAVTAYYSGLINARQRAHLEGLQSETVKLIVEENWSAASDARKAVVDWLLNATGLATDFDITKTKPYQRQMLSVFLNKDEVKEALGVRKEENWEQCSDAVKRSLHEDLMKSVKFAMEELVRKSRVLLYQGIYDLRDGVVSTEAWMKEMEWEGLESFLKAERKVWKVAGEKAGYVQRWGSLTHAVVSGTGHLAPADQGRSCQSMIEDWVLDQGLFGGDDDDDNDNDAAAKASSLRRSY